jgi:hypothetical protein
LQKIKKKRGKIFKEVITAYGALMRIAIAATFLGREQAIWALFNPDRIGQLVSRDIDSKVECEEG